MKRWLGLLTMACGVAMGQTQDLNARLDAAVERVRIRTGAPSVSVAVVEDGRIVYVKAFGKAADGVAATPATRYQLASISKTFVAQAVLLLVADGKLRLDDPVSRWFPEATDAATVTVRELLAHTSGYPDHYPESYPAGPKGRAAMPDAIIAQYGSHPLMFAPGTKFHYSNLEYEMVGRIVEKVSGRSLFAFLQERVLRPVGIIDAIDLDTIPDGSAALATGYVRYALGPLVAAPYEGPGWSFGSGQVVMTADDLAKWDIAFLAGKTLPPAMRTEETTRFRMADGSLAPDGLGLFVGGSGDLLRYYHSGGGLGFTAINMIYPQQKTAIAILSNTNVGSVVNSVADAMTFALLPLSKEDAFALDLFTGLQRGVQDRAAWSDDLTAYMSGKRLAAYRDSLLPLGAVESLYLRSRSVTDGLESRDYSLVVGGKPLQMHLLLLPNGQLEDVNVTDPTQP